MNAAHRPTTLPLLELEPALGRFGYTAHESAFLTLAACHSGYFLRRQAAQFFGSRDGGRVTQLVQKALELEHARSSMWRQKVQVYHLLARPLYAALGEPDNRNRRRHESSQIKNRILRLDFVLEHPSLRFLTSEREKVEYFLGLGIAADVLPRKQFDSRSSVPATTRYFVDKYPLFVTGSGQADDPARVVFAFIDEGLVGLSKFQRHLENYRGLFETLERFELVYVATTDALFARARCAFERGLDPELASRLTPGGPSVEALVAYFQLRKRFEDRAFGSFDRTELIQLRDGRARYSSKEFESRFSVWKRSGELIFTTNQSEDIAAAPRVQGTFRTYLLRHDYSFFGG